MQALFIFLRTLVGVLMKQPPLGWTTKVHAVDRQIDGDTIALSIMRHFVIRLVDDEIYFDTPETYRAKSPEERKRGNAATAYLYKLLTKRKKWGRKRVIRDIVLHVPGSEREKFGDSIALNRLKGMLWADGVDVVDEMIKAGYVKK